MKNTVRDILSCILVSTLLTAPAQSSAAANQCYKSFEGKSRVFVDRVDELISKNKPLEFSSDAEAQFRSVWDAPNKTDAQRFEDMFRLITDERMKRANPVTAFFMRGALKDLGENKSIYSKTLGALLAKIMGPHFNPVFNRVGVNRKELGEMERTLILMHEFEHAFHRNTNPIPFVAFAKVFPFEFLMVFRTPITPTLQRHIEARAVSSQWELVSRIPENIRQDMIVSLAQQSSVNQSALSKMATTILLTSLRNAHLPKHEFLENVAPVHGYTYRKLLNSHMGYSHFKGFLALSSLLTAYAAVNAKEANPTLIANDLDFLYRVLAYALNFQEEDKDKGLGADQSPSTSSFN